MQKKLYIGVDLGTSFIKSAVYDLAGKCHAEASEPVADERPAPGVFLQRGEMLFESVCRCIRKTTEALGTDAACVSAMAFTGQMAGCMGIDAEWNDVTTWSCTLDSRYMPYLAEQLERHGDELYRISGTSSPVMCGKYAWFRDTFPNEARRIAKYTMLNGYIIGRLSEINVSEVSIDTSLIAWTGMADLKHGAWSETLCRDMEIDRALLPNIGGCAKIGGYLSERAANRLGLKPGLPLVLGAGDKVAGCIGAGVSRDGDRIFEASSYAALSVQVDDFRPDTAEREFDIIGGIRPDSYYAHKYLQGSGITLDWFVNEFVRLEGEKSSAAFRRIEALAAQAPIGSDRMLSIGLLGGSAMPFQPHQKGLFFGHTWSHGKGHFYRSLLEGFTFELAGLLQSIGRLYPQYTDGAIKLIGGGAKSSIWPQMMADITGETFAVLDRNDVALWGAALLAAAAVGGVDDIHAAADRAVSVAREYIPDPSSTAAYAPYVREYLVLRKELQAYYTTLDKL